MKLFVTQDGSTINLDLVHRVFLITCANPYANYLGHGSDAGVLALSYNKAGLVIDVLFQGGLEKCEEVKADFDAYYGADQLPSMFPPTVWPEGMGPPDLGPGEEYDSFVSDNDFVDEGDKPF